MNLNDRIVVCGAGGYIGRHLVQYLVERGHTNIGTVGRSMADLTKREDCRMVVRGAKWVFNLAANVGGIGHVLAGDADQLRNVLINTQLVDECAREGVERYFFASSSCVYPVQKAASLRESDALPADPVGGYGWEKLFSEQLCLAYNFERRLRCSIGRLHGVYGPGDIRPEGKDHVVTALAKKMASAKWLGEPEIEVWGDGSQLRSLIYISDVVEGIYKMMTQGAKGPLNLAHPEPITVNEILDLLAEVSGYRPKRRYNYNAPVGRQNKTSDNTKTLHELYWEPRVTHRVGIHRVFNECWDNLIKK